MAKQLLRDAAVVKPTAEIIADCLGKASSVYTKFIDELTKGCLCAGRVSERGYLILLLGRMVRMSI